MLTFLEWFDQYGNSLKFLIISGSIVLEILVSPKF